ncbi:hypothetical protein [Gemella morbillorum]|jgi:hypothetical protein|uniref:Uncharacterized protein n=1 Tax=Gemella morbillorum TaxID=29391 RepID=A0AAP9HC16_9BACL|nr:hypothetical protein [Gemella morbillorum]EFV35297.1 hypothetical protein HMPREF0432_01200 [Gemella morbillorum M424]QGS08586.1 hypothetical protein FOC49_01165 [Gemella morbillorum]
MKGDIKKHYLYKYSKYIFYKKWVRYEVFQNLSQEEVDETCAEVARKTKTLALVFGILYLVIMFMLTMWVIMNPYQNMFTSWYYNTLEAVSPLINGYWGSAPYEKKGTVLLIFIEVLPIFILDLIPFLLFILMLDYILLKRKLNTIARCKEY